MNAGTHKYHTADTDLFSPSDYVSALKKYSEWLLFNANSSIFQLYHGKNKLIFNEMMIMRSPLHQTNMLSWIIIVLDHWNNSPQIDMTPHSDTLT
jgi:hypothetical protein